MIDFPTYSSDESGPYQGPDSLVAKWGDIPFGSHSL